MITGINKLKALTKHISCKYKCKFEEGKCNSNRQLNTINVNVSVEIIKNPATCSSENAQYLVNIIDDLVIT